MKSTTCFAAKSVFLTIFMALAIFSIETKAFISHQFQTKTQSFAAFKGVLSLETDERRVFDLVNREREKAGLMGLEWNPALARLARNYSEQMSRERFFSHFDNRGASVEDRADKMRIKGWRKIGENLFVCSGTNNFTNFAVQKWMKSPTHRRNILDSDWTTAGIGVAVSDSGEIYVTQVFMKN